MTNISISTDLPAGNIIVKSIDDFQVCLEPDLRDTEGSWFYWAFKAVFSQAGTYTFHIITGTRGPAVSYDNGENWDWLGEDSILPGYGGFTFTAQKNTTVLFRVCMQYLQKELDQFLQRHKDSPYLKISRLCNGHKKGRPVELLQIGNSTKKTVLLTCRHHCGESMANYVLEGIMDAALADHETGAEFRSLATMFCVPFVDKDGALDGDQGKNRKPHDHARDYGKFIYPETNAIKNIIHQNKPSIVFDIHCPWLHTSCNEYIYFVGQRRKKMHDAMERWSQRLERLKPQSVPFFSSDNMPYGTGWNSDSNYTQGSPLADYAGGLPFVSSSLAIEIPFANSRNTTLYPHMMRELGHAFLKLFIEELIMTE